MNTQEKAFARILFQNKVNYSDGQAFEDIFTSVMVYSETNFQSIKPWGMIGDRKNDGYIKSTGTYYQVFAPEDIKIRYYDTIKKVEKDFKGLINSWSPVYRFYFVVNDKYKGVHPDAETKINEIKKMYSLKDAAILTTKDIENKLFKLDDDQIIKIVGYLPDPSNIKNLDYSILNEVIEYIMNISLNLNTKENIILPDWDEKIRFNNLTTTVENYLNTASMQLYNLEYYLNNNGNYLAEELKSKINEIYMQEKKINSGDALFIEIIKKLSPEQTAQYQNIVIVIMAKYFESCDIFEKPQEVNYK